MKEKMMEMTNTIKYSIIAVALIICVGLKLYFGNNPIVADVDAGIETVVKDESGYDITPIVNAI